MQWVSERCLHAGTLPPTPMHSHGSWLSQSQPPLQEAAFKPAEASQPSRLSALACFLIGSFALGSWIDINGVFNELPLMVKQLPEGWSLPAYLAVIVQLGNVGPALFLLASRLSRGRVTDRVGVYIINATGAVALLVLAFTWSETPGGRSLPLMLLVLALSLVDCSSSVVYLSYMSAYPTAYISALYVGEGVGGLLPGLLALAQGAGGSPVCVNGTTDDGGTALHPVYAPPRYSVGVFYGLLCGMLCYSLLAFRLLTAWPFRQACPAVGPAATAAVAPAGSSQVSPETTLARETTSLVVHPPGPNRALLLGLVVVLNAWGTGLLPSLQSYSTLPYGYDAYHMAVTLANLANPLACFVTFAWRVRSPRALVALVVAGSLLCAYVTAGAAMSPEPPLVGQPAGAALMVAAWTGASALFSYAKACISAAMCESGGRRWLRLTGVATQVGAAVGAVVGFLLSVVFRALRDAPPC